MVPRTTAVGCSDNLRQFEADIAQVGVEEGFGVSVDESRDP